MACLQENGSVLQDNKANTIMTQFQLTSANADNPEGLLSAERFVVGAGILVQGVGRFSHTEDQTPTSDSAASSQVRT